MKVKYVYKPNGVCSREISFDVNDGVVTNINFVGGCPGNLKMIERKIRADPERQVWWQVIVIKAVSG